MSLGASLARLRASLQVPTLYKAPATEMDYTPQSGDYGQPMGGGYGDFGLGYAVSQPPMGAPTFGGLMGPVPVQDAPTGAPSGLDAMLQDLGAKLHAQASMAPPVPHQPKPLTDSEALIPAGIGFLAALLGGHNDQGRTADAAMGAVGNFYGAANKRHADEAHALDLKDQQDYFTRKGNAGVDAEMAKTRYQSAASAKAAQDELAGKERLIGIGNANDVALQNLKNEADPDFLISQANNDWREGRITKEEYMARVIPLMRKDPYALAELQRSGVDLNKIKGEDIVATREHRINKLKEEANKLVTGQRLDEAQADLYVKRYEHYDEETAIKLGLLKWQIESLGLTVGEKRDKPARDAAKAEYDRYNDEFARAEHDLKYWTDQRKGTSKLDDAVDSAFLSGEAKARMLADRKEADDGIRKAKAEIDRIKGELAKVKTAPAPSRSGGGRGAVKNPIEDPWAPIPAGGLEIKPSTRLGGFAPQTAADVLAMLNGDA